MTLRLLPQSRQWMAFPARLAAATSAWRVHHDQPPLGLTANTKLRLGCCVVTLLAFALHLQLLDRYPLREDEAIYSVWALHSWRADPLLLTVWPDKPPLFFWLLAPLLQLFGATGASARLLNIGVSTLTPLIVGATARRQWGGQAGLVATLVMALNPFALSFAATAYTDPLLVLSGQLALYGALSGNAWGAGLWLGAAIMTKQQGLLYLPLVVGALPLAVRPPLATRLPRRSTFIRLGIGMALIIGPILYWDSLRWQVAPSPWDLSVQHYGALTLLPPATWWPRLLGWWPLLWHLTAANPLWLAGALLGVGAAWQGRSGINNPNHRGVILLLIGWGLGFLLLHIVTSVQVWDRYLLPLAPLVAFVAAWAWRYRPWPHHQWRWQLVGVLLVVLLMPPAWRAATGGYPLGGDHGHYQGLVAATTWLRSYAPTNVILYHRHLGWQAQFYFYAERETGSYEFRWFPNGIYLADNAAKSPYRRRFLIQPRWAAMRDLVFNMTTRNLQLSQRYVVDQMIVYEISEPAQPMCAWCQCEPKTPWPTVAIPASQSTLRKGEAP